MTYLNKYTIGAAIVSAFFLLIMLMQPDRLEQANKQLQLNQRRIDSINLDITELQKQITELEIQKSKIETESTAYKTILQLNNFIIPKADASWFGSELEFGDRIQIPEISFIDYLPEFKILQWNNAPAWKNERLKEIQVKLYANGFNQEEVKALVLMAIQESGVNFHSKGDSGCSEGIWQRNKCVHGKNPYNFDTVQGNVDYITPRMKVNFSKYDIDRAIIAHNSPAKAARNAPSPYLWQVKQHEVNVSVVD